VDVKYQEVPPIPIQETRGNSRTSAILSSTIYQSHILFYTFSGPISHVRRNQGPASSLHDVSNGTLLPWGYDYEPMHGVRCVPCSNNSVYGYNGDLMQRTSHYQVTCYGAGAGLWSVVAPHYPAAAINLLLLLHFLSNPNTNMPY
jgi:hypothetical protein